MNCERCNHPKGWHLLGSGSCLECLCDAYQGPEEPKAPERPIEAALKRMSYYQAKHILESFVAAHKERGLVCGDFVQDIMDGNCFIGSPDTLFRVLVLDHQWGVPESSVVYYAARRYLQGEP